MEMFQAFRDMKGGPTYYKEVHRSRALVDFNLVVIFLVFVTALVGSGISLLISRRKKINTIAMLALLMGTILCISTDFESTEWLYGHALATDSLTFARPKLEVYEVGLHVGLHGVNITLTLADPIRQQFQDIYFNEYFHWDEPTSLNHQKGDALLRGLPVPILTVLEYLSAPETLCIGSHLRYIAHWTSWILYAAGWIWAWTFILCMAVPNHSCYGFMGCGACLLISVLFYGVQAANIVFDIRINGSILWMSWGWNFWFTVVMGAANLLTGFFLLFWKDTNGREFATALEFGFDTPFYWPDVKDPLHAKHLEGTKPSTPAWMQVMVMGPTPPKEEEIRIFLPSPPTVEISKSETLCRDATAVLIDQPAKPTVRFCFDNLEPNPYSGKGRSSPAALEPVSPTVVPKSPIHSNVRYRAPDEGNDACPE